MRESGEEGGGERGRGGGRERKQQTGHMTDKVEYNYSYI